MMRFSKFAEKYADTLSSEDIVFAYKVCKAKKAARKQYINECLDYAATLD